ncbi:unnamed protein product [Aphanomyces euteiches]|uniref:KATNIP domain-containing protein n=1 Tax=Aphanomyces euteiches TaxID=100861 RepID=A0A6G0XWE3_9STRA|nr:hypothetical protein Ae201684_000734 [Aphanomyces euteiches]KAH9099810.1 hypothetical protein Ae201684P_018820 [Aphanomyces euteiches]KAH9154512.1 hypothetical protein AeRB84_003410 [Aphanomyces euteiches]
MSDAHRKERKWSKPLTTIPAAEPKSTPLSAPAVEKQMEYIRALEEKNRLLKKMEETSKSDREVQNRVKEVGFTTNFNGENAHRKQKHARQTDKARAKSAGPTKLHSSSARIPAKHEESKRTVQSTGALPLHTARTDSESKAPPARQKWSKPQGIAEQRDGRIVFSQVASAPSTGDSDKEDGDSYLDESFEEFDEAASSPKSSNSPKIIHAVKPASDQQPSTFVPSETHGDKSSSNGQIPVNIQSLLHGMTKEKQNELMGFLQTFTESNKQPSDVNSLRQSIGDASLWNQLTVPIAQLTKIHQLDWEEEVQRKLRFEREESERLIAQAEARRVEMLKKFEAEEKELETLMLQRRQETLKKLQEMTLSTSLTPPTASPSTSMPTVQSSEAPTTTAASSQATKDPVVIAVPVKAPEAPIAVAAPAPSASPMKEQLLPPQISPPTALQMSMELPPAVPAIQSTKTDSSVSFPPPTTFELRFKLLSSWGQTQVIGLTQISVYDMEGNELNVIPDSLRLFSGQADAKPIPKSNNMVRDLAKLFDGLAHTTNDKEMWLGKQIDANPLQIAFSVAAVPSKVCVWNYNGKLHACVRDMEVFVDKQCKWSGSLPETFGSEDDHTCTWINVSSSVRKKPKEVKPQAPPQPATSEQSSTEQPADSGPIWLTKNASASSMPKPLDFSFIASEAKSQEAALSDAKPLTTSRRRLIDTPKENECREPPLPVPPVVPQFTSTLQSSWDTLEHFKRSNKSRLDTAECKESTVQPMSARTASKSSLDKLRPPTTTAALEANSKPAIPILPRGRTLVLECFTTWGDPYYIGLNGLDLFDDRGQPVKVSSPQNQVRAVPASINVLPEYASDKDPRVATNLLDGVNYTCDDLHMWLAPFSPNQLHTVTVEFDAQVVLSMVRIWNYNKSRAHSFRGVKNARLLLDNAVIFQGEIRQAPGILGAVEQCCEVILFTTDESLLAKIEQVDSDPTVDATLDVVHDICTIPRPTTAEEQNNRRPKTSAVNPRRLQPPTLTNNSEFAAAKHDEPQDSVSVRDTVRLRRQPSSELCGRVLKLVIQSTWGGRHYVGLTGITVWLVRHNQVISMPLSLAQLDATPRDLNSLGYTGDPRTLDKLIDGVNGTCDDTHMWLVPFEGRKAEVTIRLESPSDALYGLDVWNYNKNAEDTSRGAKVVTVVLDDRPILNCVLRKAPGVAFFDFKQTIILDEWLKGPLPGVPAIGSSSAYKNHLIRQDYEPPLHPSGFLLKFVLWSTWGDPYYVGLNGFELYDARGDKIPPPTVIAASPSSLADVDVKNDVRVPENLFNGQNNTWDAGDAWLAPLASSLGRPEGNIVVAAYDMPITLSMIKVYNYSKTPDRGAREIEIYLDDLKVYMGTLRQAPPAPGVARTGKPQQAVEFGQPILFTLNPAQVESEKRKVLYCGGEDQDVLCINEGQVVIESKAMYRAPDPGAEGVFVDLAKRPTTSLGRK